MNEVMTEEEEELRKFMNLVLTNLAQEQQLANISIWELVRYLHANPDEIDQIYSFSGPLQDEFGCDSSKAYYFWIAWKSYSKANFAN